MSKVKNQHYIPQLYLKHFAVNDYIYVFDKTLDSPLGTKGINIKNIATERYFYDFLIELIPEEFKTQIDVQHVEKSLSKIESEFNKTLNKIIGRYHLQRPDSMYYVNALTEDEKLDLSMFLAIQATRTRDFRNSRLEAEEKGVRELINRCGEKGKDFIEDNFEYFKIGKIGKKKKGKKRKFELIINEKCREQIAQHQHVKTLIDGNSIKKLAEILAHHIWFIGINKSSIPLYTSDNPLVRREWKEDLFFSNTGFASEGIEIAFPITPKLIIIMCERSYHNRAQVFENKYVNLQEMNVIYYNRLQVFDANKQIYSINNNFDVALEILRNYPESRVRNRWDVS